MRIERQLQGTLNTIFTELIKEKGLESRLHPYTFQEKDIDCTYAKKVEKLIQQITSDTKLQKKILETYWKEKFQTPYNEKQIANNDQLRMF
jgi:hypothetical protein